MFAQLKPVAYHEVDVAPIPFNELLALAQFQRQDQQATEQRVDAYTQFVYNNPSFGAGRAHAAKLTEGMQEMIKSTDLRNPTGRASLRRAINEFVANPFWGKNKANYTNYQQSQQAMSHLAQQGMLNEADRLSFEAYANEDPKAKQALHDMYVASGVDPAEAKAMAESSWDGQSDFNYQFSRFNAAELKDAAEAAAKGVTPTIIETVDEDGIRTMHKGIRQAAFDDAGAQFSSTMNSNQTADRAFKEYLVKGGMYTKDPKTGRKVLKTQAELSADHQAYFKAMYDAAAPDLAFDQRDSIGQFASIEQSVNQTDLAKYQLNRTEAFKLEMFDKEVDKEKEQFDAKVKAENDLADKKHKFDLELSNDKFKHDYALQAARLKAQVEASQARAAAKSASSTSGSSGVFGQITVSGGAPQDKGALERMAQVVSQTERDAQRAIMRRTDLAIADPTAVIQQAMNGIIIAQHGVRDPEGHYQQALDSSGPRLYDHDRAHYINSPASLAARLVSAAYKGKSKDDMKLAMNVLTQGLDSKIEAVGGWGKFKEMSDVQQQQLVRQTFDDLNSGYKIGVSSIDESVYAQSGSNLVTATGNGTGAFARANASMTKIQQAVGVRTPTGFNGGATGAKLIQNDISFDSIIADKAGASYSVKDHYVKELGRPLRPAEQAHFASGGIKSTGRIINGHAEVVVEEGKGDADAITPGVYLVKLGGQLGRNLALHDVIEDNRKAFVKGNGYNSVTVPNWDAVRAGEVTKAPSSWYRYSSDVTDWFDDGSGVKYRVVNVPTEAFVKFMTSNGDSGIPADVAAETVPMVMMKPKGDQQWYYSNFILDPAQVMGMGLNTSNKRK